MKEKVDGVFGWLFLFFLLHGVEIIYSFCLINSIV
jgi:hypothetical protein